ncbi:hypothetical protein B0H11DRAFT_2076586 [Mycena galericulata]|nr:hypothetical protein B0H11DRAFT_2076586 [Mycena galericulata]
MAPNALTKSVDQSISTFDRRLLSARDCIRFTGTTRVRLHFRFADENPNTTTPSVNFRCAAPRYTLPGTDTKGFLYYHVPYPEHFLSAGLRFRSTKTALPSSFDAGHNIMDRAGLPWTLPLTFLLRRRRFSPIVRRLVMDGLLTEEQVSTGIGIISRKDVMHALKREGVREGGDEPHVHAIGESFYADFTRVMHLCVTGPHSILRVALFPQLASQVYLNLTLLVGCGTARFERAREADGESESLHFRILTIQTPIKYLPHYEHLPRPWPGMLLPRLTVSQAPAAAAGGKNKGKGNELTQTQTRTDPEVSNPHALSKDSDRPWTWEYDKERPAYSASLYCLFHPPAHFPPLPLPPLREVKDSGDTPTPLPLNSQARAQLYHARALRTLDVNNSPPSGSCDVETPAQAQPQPQPSHARTRPTPALAPSHTAPLIPIIRENEASSLIPRDRDPIPSYLDHGISVGRPDPDPHPRTAPSISRIRKGEDSRLILRDRHPIPPHLDHDFLQRRGGNRRRIGNMHTNWRP